VDACKQGVAALFKGIVDKVGCMGKISIGISFEQEQFSKFQCQGGNTGDDFCSESIALKLCNHQDGFFCFGFPTKHKFHHCCGTSPASLLHGMVGSD